MSADKGRARLASRLRGRSREQIVEALDRHDRAELIEVICTLATVEPLFKPSEVAALSAVSKQTVLADMHAGKFGDFFKRSENQVMLAASAVQAWRDGFRVRVAGKESA